MYLQHLIVESVLYLAPLFKLMERGIPQVVRPLCFFARSDNDKRSSDKRQSDQAFIMHRRKSATTNCIWLSVPRAVWYLLWRHVHNVAPVTGHPVVSDTRLLPMKKSMLKLNSDNIVDVRTSVFDYRGVKCGAEKFKILRLYFYTLEHIEMLQNVLGHLCGVGARIKNKAAAENDLLNVITHLKRSSEIEKPLRKVSLQ
jgi:hypothetical protein